MDRSVLLRKLTAAAICLALCMLLPFVTGQIPEIGNALSPMHIPVLLCGFLCGWPYGLAVGFIAPLLRFALFGMPPIFPTGVAMAFELAVYGLLTGLLYAMLPRKPLNVYVALVLAMLGGRLIWGAVTWVLLSASGEIFTLAMFLSGAFIKAVPGIICHILLVPAVVLALQRSRALRFG